MKIIHRQTQRTTFLFESGFFQPFTKSTSKTRLFTKHIFFQYLCITLAGQFSPAPQRPAGLHITFGVSAFYFIVNFFGSMIFGRKSVANPWNACSLEWTTQYPIPHGNFATAPVVYRGPHEFSSPETEETDRDFIPQTEPPASTSARSRQASMWTRLSPDSAARSPSLAEPGA